jgi:peptide chain release factor 2
MRERTRLTDAIDGYRELENALEDAVGLIELAEEEDDQDTIAAAEADLATLQTKAQTARLQSLLSGEADPNDAYLEIHAGAGGTEAQDWAQMLVRMYTATRSSCWKNHPVKKRVSSR